jgi:hypothetical protein
MSIDALTGATGMGGGRMCNDDKQGEHGGGGAKFAGHGSSLGSFCSCAKLGRPVKKRRITMVYGHL